MAKGLWGLTGACGSCRRAGSGTTGVKMVMAVGR